jgi:hypothetical protein
VVEQVVVVEGTYFGWAQRRKDRRYGLCSVDEQEKELEGDDSPVCWSSRELEDEEGQEED